MSNWLFALVVLAFGVLLAVFVDRAKDKPGPPQMRRERKKWLYYWFAGRFPTKEEMEDGEDDEKDKPQ